MINKIALQTISTVINSHQICDTRNIIPDKTKWSKYQQNVSQWINSDPDRLTELTTVVNSFLHGISLPVTLCETKRDLVG